MKKNIYIVQGNIQIISDENIIDGDWVLGLFLNKYLIMEYKEGVSFPKDTPYTISKNMLKKIILTTDETLIKDGVQAIDKEFLEWLDKNQSCEFVEIKKGKMKLNCDGEEIGFPDMSLYKIIIPQEEPKQDFYKIGDFHTKCDDACKYHCTKGNTQLAECLSKQESLENAAEKYANKKGDIPTTELEDAIFKQGFIDGAKWQQEKMYSEKEVYNLLYKLLPDKQELDEWFDQFKKK